MITNETAKKTYTIQEDVVTYPIGFSFGYNPDTSPQIKVCLNKDLQNPLEYNVNYTLSPDGLSVVLVSGYEVGDRMDIIRDIPLVQISDYTVGRIDPEQIESDLDSSVMRDQQLNADIQILKEVPDDLQRQINDLDNALDSHTANVSNPHSVTKAQVGLGNVDNTSDLNKPVSTATQTALDLKANSADLATVATSGSYNDLLNKPTIPSAQVNSDWNANSGVAEILNKPTLGTMAAEDKNDYATSAQGALADTAVQSVAEGSTNGTVAVDGTDVAVHGLGSAAYTASTTYASSAQGALADTAVQPGDLATVATTGNYSDLSGTPTIPTVNNATLTIQKNGTDVQTFTANASSDVTANITVPTKISDLTNDSNFADKNLSNLTGTGKNISNWSTNVSNCVIEIPQDIKLELSAGTLTLKSGSKIYKPNGSGVFDVINITTDKTATYTTNGKRCIFINESGNMQQWAADSVFSGTTAPTSAHYPMWYDTANNVIQSSSDYGSTWSGSFSFPIAIITVSDGAISSIDQVFNGFGYIGNTIFALPGVKVAYPDGRNTDGTLKSGIISLTTVFKTDISYSLSDGSYILLTPYSVNASPVIISDDEPEIHNYYERWHSPKLNKSFYHTQGATSWTQSSMALFGKIAKTSSAFTKFDAGHPFRAVDYNNLSKVASSGSYNDLTGTPTLATVATSGAYADLTGTPTIPAAQVNADWEANSGVAEILNKPTIPDVDQTYDDTSANPQSGIAVSEAILRAQLQIDDALPHVCNYYVAPTAANNYTWVRKYMDGWVEQGGIIPINTTSVSFPVSFADEYSYIQITAKNTSGNSNSAPWNYLGPTAQTATGFTINGNGTLVRAWEAKGIAATYSEYSYTTPGTYTLPLAAGTYEFDLSAGGGGGAAASYLTKYAGASGGTGAYGSFTLTLAAADTVTIVVGAHGLGKTKTDGTPSSTAGGTTSISTTSLGTIVTLTGGEAAYVRATDGSHTATVGAGGTVTTSLLDHNLSDGSAGSAASTSSGKHSASYTSNPSPYATYGYGGGWAYNSNNSSVSASNGGDGYAHIMQIA